MNLPNIFQNKNIKPVINEQDIFYGKEEIKNKVESKKNIREEIKKIFSTKDYIYKIDCIITTNKKTYNTFIIGKTSTNLITINNELIPIKDIIDIKKR